MTSALAEDVVRRIKGLSSSGAGSDIPIVDSERGQIGALSAIDRDRVADPATAEMLTRWRQASMQFFLTQFQATTERTASWLSSVILPENSRILFLVLDETGAPRGTLGVCGISASSAEIDNVNRGEAGGHKRLMYFALASLIDWLYRDLKRTEVMLRVLSHNARAVALYDSIGFSHVAVSPLVKQQIGDTLVHRVADASAADQGEPVDFELVTMRLDRESFYQRHSWL